MPGLILNYLNRICPRFWRRFFIRKSRLIRQRILKYAGLALITKFARKFNTEFSLEPVLTDPFIYMTVEPETGLTSLEPVLTDPFPTL